MKIVTEYVCPPIPTRRFDWRATFEGYDEGDPMGYGPTEAAAIAELKESADLLDPEPFTPGPWNVKEARGEDGRICFLEVCPIRADGDPYRGTIASVSSAEHIDGITRAEARANATLIATSTGLLALLVESQTSIGGDWRERRDALISKATGSEA